MKDVTLPPIRYMALCTVCSRFIATDRRDTFVCSVACRVRGHRNSEIKGYREMCADVGVTPGYMARYMAAQRICPELLTQAKGRGGLDSIKAEIWARAHEIARQQQEQAND